ncbi:uncharacterized protein LOC124943561 [Impatiens glandulifera]|uniref:uncharacterized protein LOC124943561 n=1 Tax=Impatiens glandulifera TaxID=253017 RepID=UPI001FB12BF6|nr:uncharacterized protein LOC124943561 [Impatiens glandulifera]
MAMTPLYLGEPTVLHLFPQYLDGAALRWYHQKKIVYLQTIDELASAFIERFSMHLSLERSEKKLKNVKQGENEKFTVFIERWKAVAEKIDSLPSEQRQIDMILDNVNGRYSVGFACQDLIDQKIIPKPEIVSNLLPEHQVNLISANEPVNPLEVNMINPWPKKEDRGAPHPPVIPRNWWIIDNPDSSAPKIVQREVLATQSGADFQPSFMKTTPAVNLPGPSNDPRRENEPRALNPGDSLLAQLKKTNANISIWEILMYCIEHRQAVLNVLSQASIPANTTPEELVGIISSTPQINMIGFKDKDLPAPDEPHVKALYISVKMSDKVIPMTLIDNGSALNICPWKTLQELDIYADKVLPSDLCVRGFDNSRREIMGSYLTTIYVVDVPFEVEFCVINMRPSYNLILGRPWLHQAKALASTLHQKIRFMANDKLVTIEGEKYVTTIIGSTHSTNPEIELSGFDICLIFRQGQDSSSTPDFTPYSAISMRLMQKMRYFPGMGLGPNATGMTSFPWSYYDSNNFGISYTPTEGEESRKGKISKQFIPIPQTLNGQFVRAGETTLCFEFPEPFFNQLVRDLSLTDEDVVVDEHSCKINSTNLLAVDKALVINLSVDSNITPFLDCEIVSDVVINKEVCNDNPDEMSSSFCNKACNKTPEYSFEYMSDNDDVSFNSKFNFEMKNFLEHEDEIVSAAETTIEVNLNTQDDHQIVLIGQSLSDDERREMIELLKTNKDVFAWSYKDMPRVDPAIVRHQIPLYLEAKPVKQRLRRIKTEVVAKVKEEVQKQLEAKFLETVDYPAWIANVVPILKKDGRMHVCVDYRDLNKASPKDSFPLPHIDILVDHAADNQLLFFMDEFSGYNQILIAEEDKEKTTFITEVGTSCFRVMPFGLKNAGATYQRAVTMILHDMIHKEVEVYIDDMIVKSKDRQGHIPNLDKFLQRIRKYGLRLNPKKCAFRVTSGKMLGFLITQRGIEIDPSKIEAITAMPVPRNEREVRGFLGKIQFISRFISKLTLTCDPLFKLLKKD